MQTSAGEQPAGKLLLDNPVLLDPQTEYTQTLYTKYE